MLSKPFFKPQGKFADWSKRKIVGKGFIENVDYISSHKIVKRDNGGNKSTEYMLTVDTAKQVKVVAEYVGLVGNKHGTNQWTGNSRHSLSQEEIASLWGNP